MLQSFRINAEFKLSILHLRATLYATFRTVQYGNITELYQAEKELSGVGIFLEVMHNYSLPTSAVTRSD